MRLIDVREVEPVLSQLQRVLIVLSLIFELW